MRNSIDSPPRRKPTKPDKPTKDFPLFPHDCGMWAKKILTKLVYFTSWRQDPTGAAALEQFEREWPFLKKGETPPRFDASKGRTLKQLVNDFLASKEALMNANGLAPRTFHSYYKVCEAIIEHFGRERPIDDLRPEDFRAYRTTLAKRYGVVALRNAINYTCILFNHARNNGFTTKTPQALYGSNFERPSALAIRRDRNAAGPKLYERTEVLAILSAADVQLKAMILLGINCGFGNTDVATLPRAAIDLESAWVNYPRPKTEVPRRVPLWPETVDAIKAWLAVRREPREPNYKRLVFLTRLG